MGTVSKQEVAGFLVPGVYLELYLPFWVCGLDISFHYLCNNFSIFVCCGKEGTVVYNDVRLSCVFREAGVMPLIDDLGLVDDVNFT